MPQRSLLPALALVHDPWEEKFLTVTKDSLQKKVVQANGRCRPDEIPDEEREGHDVVVEEVRHTHGVERG
ncbi:hypothetical protein L915_15572 [Phytophthora nicotianae]|nr:hypothetical protein L915_15572 [Phytophthora nicotianae]